MSIIDHLIRCATQEEQQELLDFYGGSCSFACKVVIQSAVWDNSDPENPIITAPEVPANGYHVWISLDHASSELQELPDNACRLIADRNAAIAGSNEFMLYHAADIGPETLMTAIIDPIPSGSNYPLGNYVQET